MIVVAITGQMAQAAPLEWSPILKVKDGTRHSDKKQYCANSNDPGDLACDITWANADKYCKDPEMHNGVAMRLPTAREWAEYAQSHYGAKGIVSVDTARSLTIYKADSEGEPVVDFKYDPTGYQRPSGPMGYCFLWSSSVDPTVPGLAYGLLGFIGYFSWNERNHSHGNAVRCVVERR